MEAGSDVCKRNDKDVGPEIRVSVSSDTGAMRSPSTLAGTSRGFEGLSRTPAVGLPASAPGADVDPSG